MLAHTKLIRSVFSLELKLVAAYGEKTLDSFWTNNKQVYAVQKWGTLIGLI